VSPGNVLLGASGEVRLTDFGIAHESADETAVTATGTVVGTLGYLAPELLRGEPATPASDLFGLAAITYEMLAGAPPFRATTPVGLVEAHRSPAAPVAGIDASLDQAVRAGLAPNPADRPASVAAFTGGLVAALEGDRTEVVGMPVVAPVPVAAAPIAAGANRDDVPAAVSRPERSRRARPVAGSVAAAAALAIGALVLAAAMTDPRSGNPGPSAPPASVAPAEVTAAPAEPAAAPAGEPVAPAGDDGEEKPDKDDDKGKGGDDKGNGNDKGGGDREDDNKGEG
jgi:serine/threonine-protein kinase